MNKSQFIINNCPNFFKIINFKVEEDDIITSKLINIYRTYIYKIDLTSREEQTLLKELDYVLSRYIDDYEFRKSLILHIPDINFKSKSELVKAFITGMMDIYNKYLEGTTKGIHIAKWI